MIDLHCHILPGIDDGSADMETSIAMARQAVQSGVTHIVATPHCNLPGNFRTNYRDADLAAHYKEFIAELKKENIPLTILSGCEVMATSDVPRLLREHKLLTINNSDYLLVEFYFNLNSAYMDNTFDAIRAEGLKPIVAHPERYGCVQADPGIAARWFEEGLIIQSNKGSILGSLGRRAEKAANFLLQHGLVHLVASDAHNTHGRSTDMSELMDYLNENVGPEYTEILTLQNPLRICGNKPVVDA